MAPTLRQLTYAVSLADHLHFRRAAAACGVTQPALSVQIKHLEETLGAVLFERSRRRVLLTPTGAAVVRQARRILRDVDDLAQRVAVREPLTGTIRLGADPTVGPYLLPRVLPGVRKSHPGLRLILEEDLPARLLHRLEVGSLDLLLLSLPVEAAEMSTLRLYRERFVAVLPPGHALAEQEELRLGDLSAQPGLLLEEGQSLRDQVRAFCSQVAAEVRGTSLGSLVQMAANGLGPTVLPALAVSDEVPEGTAVELRPFARPSPSRQIALAWRRGSPREVEFRLLGKLLRPV